MPQPSPTSPPLPSPRGPISGHLFSYFADRRPRAVPEIEAADADDVQLALYCCYELAYRGFLGVAADIEWDLWVLELRARLEAELLNQVREAVGEDVAATPGGAERHLLDLAGSDAGPSLSTYMENEGTVEELQELSVHRSAYQLKEADPHTWGLPRLAGECKGAMVEIQADEYGGGVADQMHATLFAGTMIDLGLDPTYGAYLDHLPAVTLATTNLVSMFGLHRRWRGALVGHLALFEMTSIRPMGRYAAAMTRLGLPASARRFYEVHVEADAMHEKIALERMVRGLLADEPELATDVAFGASALSAVEGMFTDHLLRSWSEGRSSLRNVEQQAVPIPA